MAEIIVGFGEIGKAVRKAICPDALVYDISNPASKPDAGGINVLHICFPYSDSLVLYAKEYINLWKPEHIAIWSSVPIGTTKLISTKAVHTPVEGKHPELAKSISLMTRWVGYNDKAEGAYFSEYFKLQKPVRLVKNTDCTEALKLLSTTEYGVNLIYADYKKRVADAIGMDFELTKQWNRDYNRLYQELGLDQFQKFVLDPPDGTIGGHCVRENSLLLNEQFSDSLLQRIIAMKR